MAEKFYRSADDENPFDGGVFWRSGNNQDVYLRKEDDLVFKAPKFHSALHAKLNRINSCYKEGESEFDAATFCTRILSAFEQSGIPFPEDWWVQAFEQDEELLVGFWQTYYHGAIENVQSPYKNCVSEEGAFFQPKEGGDPVFVDWDSTLHDIAHVFSEPEDCTLENLEEKCQAILLRPQFNRVV